MSIEAIVDVAARTAPKAEPVAPTKPPPDSNPAPVELQPTTTEGDASSQGVREPGREEVEQVLEGINTFLKSDGNHIQFSMHQEAQRLMVQVIDNETQEVVRTFPPKELLDLAARIGEMVGTLIDQTG